MKFEQGGGMYENKIATLERIKKTITEILPQNVRARLVLENDEVRSITSTIPPLLIPLQLCYTAEDLLPLCEELDVPLVFGTFHLRDTGNEANNLPRLPP